MSFSNSLSIGIISILLSGCGVSAPQTQGNQAQQNSASEQFSILSYNTYLLKTGLKNTLVDERAQLIPDHLANVGADILVLQEVWEQRHVDFFTKRLESHGYTYRAFVNSRTDQARLGNGQIIFSRYPIYEKTINFSPWKTRTSWTEKLANKGLLSASVNINGRFVKIFNAHTSTKRLDRDSGDYDREHVKLRKSQFDQIIDSVNQDSSNSKILAGDLNVHPFSYDASQKAYSKIVYDSEYLYLRNFSQMQNVFTDEEMKNVSTFEPSRNRWASDGIIVDDAENQLIDYQLYKGGLKLKAKQIIMTGEHRIPNPNAGVTIAPLSDHYGILSHFQVE